MALEERIVATYEFRSSDRSAARRLARRIAVEQTVEMPLSAVRREIRASVVGQLEHLEPLGAGRWRATISYPPELARGELASLLNLLFGNLSLMGGLRLVECHLPPVLMSQFSGPRFGIEGVRRMSGVSVRPLIASAIKPVGLDSLQLAELAYRFARAGVDIVKDDHGLYDQPYAPFAERVARCADAVAKANAETGGRALYFPHVGASHERLEERLTQARAQGCQGVLLAPLLVGPDRFWGLASRGEIAILAHPSFSGAYLERTHGIAPELLLGKFFRLIGADGVIFANVGGRFPVTQATCDAIVRNLTAHWAHLRAAFPVAGGGVDARKVDCWIERYGKDLILLISSSLYARRDLERAARELVERVRRYE